jgi:hypothetical protein
MICRRHLPYQPKIIVLWLALFMTQPQFLCAQTPNSVEDLARRATLIFLGTVEKAGASTMPAVKANAATAVVRVDQVIDSPGAPPGLAGKPITVQLLEAGSVKAGSQLVFFTKGWLLGESMAVIEVGRLGRDTNIQRLTEQINSVHQKVADEALQNQLATAEAVISGRVTSVRRAEIPRVGSEHDPDWYTAMIQVESVIKGQIPAHEVILLFPHSDDVMWHDSPKFKEGQQGVWLLHRNQARLAGIENQLTALRPLDFHPREELGRVERLVKAEQ